MSNLSCSALLAFCVCDTRLHRNFWMEEALGDKLETGTGTPVAKD